MSQEGQLRTAYRAFKRFWPFIKPDRKLLWIGIAMAVTAAAGEVVAVYLFGVITDKALAAKSLSAYWTPAFTWLAAALVGAGATFLGGILTTLAGERFLLRLRDNVFAHVQKVPLDFLDNNRLGDLMTRLTDDLEAIEGLVASGFIRTVTAAVSVVAFGVSAFVIRWDLALAACLLAPIFWLVSRTISGRFQEVVAEERAGNGGIASVVEESLSNQAVIQAYNRQAAEQRRLHEQGTVWLRARMAEAKLSTMYGPVVQVIETVCVLVVLGMGAWELSASRITLGGLLSFAAYLGYLYPPVQQLGAFSLTAAEAQAAIDRIDDIMTVRPPIAENGERDNGWRGTGHVDFEDVVFQYPQASQPTVKRLSFTARRGELVALSGPSGAGKSTVTKLLLRFYDPTAGRIMIDGVDIRRMPLATLRENVTLLHQESQLFTGSVYDNIAYARPDATPEQIFAAARAADAHDFITNLADGYHSDVGHRGRLLSGGQRQRVAIARALLRDTPILVLDEPTTGLDRESSHRIMTPLRRLMAGRTTILITHDGELAATADVEVRLSGSPRAEVPYQPPQEIRAPRPAPPVPFGAVLTAGAAAINAARSGRFTVVGAPRAVGRARVDRRTGADRRAVGRASAPRRQADQDTGWV